MRAFRLLFFLVFSLSASAQQWKLEKANFVRFSEREKYDRGEFNRLVPSEFRNHPDAGRLPFRQAKGFKAVERIDKRTEFSNYFVEVGKNSHFSIMQSASPINYLDENGWWREINPRLKSTSVPLVFVSDEQPAKMKIDLSGKFVNVSFGSNKLTLAKDIQLIHRNSKGDEVSLGKGDWINFTAGDDGIRIIDFYPGIDLVFIVAEGSIESNFILNKRLPITDGVLIMRQIVDLPKNSHWDSQAAYAGFESKNISDANEQTLFTFESCYAFENDPSATPFSVSTQVRNGNLFDVLTPLSWLNDNGRKYPVIIDPLVSVTGTVAAAVIAGTKYSAVCWTNSCDYNMSVLTPAFATVYNIIGSFEYRTAGVCLVKDGGFSMEMSGTCNAPTGALPVWTNQGPSGQLPGVCSLFPSIITEFVPCFPAGSCVPQNLNFVLHFYRCNSDTSTTCSGNCIRASQPWVIEVQGHSLEMQFLSPSMQVCGGTSVDLVVVPQFGIGPYTYDWNSGASVNDTFTVSPLATTIYSVVVTDACGNTVSGADTITITTNNNPGFTISPITSCVGQPIQLTGNGSDPVTDYDWTVPGSNQPGGVINDNQTPTIQYALAGNYNITLQHQSGGCLFDSTLSITINALSAPDVTISTASVGPLCVGDTLTYHATPVNGGVNPTYDWIVDGAIVQTGTVDSLVTSNLHNGSIVQAVLHSNSTCVSVATDTASLFVAMNSGVLPTIAISPDTSVCPGSPITFTSVATNEGTTPTYQWSINGVSVLGATGSTFTTTIGATDSIIGLILVSSLRCVAQPNGLDTVHVTLLQNVSPAVVVTSDASANLCSGDTVHFTASPVNGGASPSYIWYVNNIPVSGPGANNTFSLAAAPNSSIVSVQLTSSYACLATPTAADADTIQAVAAAVPSVAVVSIPFVVCDGKPISFLASGVNGGTTPAYHWYVNGVLQNEDSSFFNAGALQDSDLVTVEYVSSIPCSNPPVALTSYTVQNFPSPTANFIYENPYPSAFLSELEFTNLSLGATSWMWYFPDSDSTAVLNPSHTFPGEGSYTVTLAVKNGYGCTDTITYVVIIKEELAVFIPNTFTPNGDFINETFTVTTE
ncbi:MAG: PKD domain-containing protein [Bacteroidetes bacterium]|nr:PKD domain-containing protein [Bacteroidota bacterium]